MMGKTSKAETAGKKKKRRENGMGFPGKPTHVFPSFTPSCEKASPDVPPFAIDPLPFIEDEKQERIEVKGDKPRAAREQFVERY